MPQTAKLPLTKEERDLFRPDQLDHFNRMFRFACRRVATMEGAPKRCRRKDCRETGKCRLDYDGRGDFTCPGCELPGLGLFAGYLFFILADFAHDLMEHADRVAESDEATPFK